MLWLSNNKWWMLMSTDKEKDNAEKELDFDDEALVDVEISDKDIEL